MVVYGRPTTRKELLTMATFSPVSGLMMIPQYGSVSKPCTPGEHQNSW